MSRDERVSYWRKTNLRRFHTEEKRTGGQMNSDVGLAAFQPRSGWSSLPSLRYSSRRAATGRDGMGFCQWAAIVWLSCFIWTAEVEGWNYVEEVPQVKSWALWLQWWRCQPRSPRCSQVTFINYYFCTFLKQFCTFVGCLMTLCLFTSILEKAVFILWKAGIGMVSRLT